MNLTLKTIACVDASSASPDVCDWAAWAARRLDTPLELLHVLERHPELAPLADFSGTLGMDVREDLLQDLASIDERRSKLAQEHGRLLLEQLRARLETAGLSQVTQRQRHGDLSENLLDLQNETRLFVLGRHGRTAASGKLHLDHHLERAIRSVARPVLVATGAYRKPQRFMVAFDDSLTGRKTVERIALSPLLKGLACHVVQVSSDAAGSEQALAWAHETLQAEGFEVTTAHATGEPEEALVGYAQTHEMHLLAMGAYGHSRIRQLILGSTTTTLLRTSAVPVLILR
jgi:nucleotide-binding universal stress UspA family protein